MAPSCLLSLLSLLLCSTTARTQDQECSFTADCQKIPRCQNIADASCVCNFGKCIIDGNPFFRGSECDVFTDCPCSGDPASCFCRGGFCISTPWECHQASDCGNMTKCKDKQCACEGDLCSWECSNTADCKDFYCNTANGYTCECQASQCAYVQKPKECRSMVDCVRAGLCNEQEPCACTSDYCGSPWWVSGDTNCRNDQDCESTIGMCRGAKCECGDMVARNRYEVRGTCKLKESVVLANPSSTDGEDILVFQ